MSLYLGGMATVDELYFPTKGWAGLALRTFDLGKKQWSIYWVSSLVTAAEATKENVDLAYNGCTATM